MEALKFGGSSSSGSKATTELHPEQGVQPLGRGKGKAPVTIPARGGQEAGDDDDE